MRKRQSVLVGRKRRFHSGQPKGCARLLTRILKRLCAPCIRKTQSRVLNEKAGLGNSQARLPSIVEHLINEAPMKRLLRVEGPRRARSHDTSKFTVGELRFFP